MDIDDLKAKALDALPDDETTKKISEKVREHTSDDVDDKVAKAEQWIKDHNKD